MKTRLALAASSVVGAAGGSIAFLGYLTVSDARNFLSDPLGALGFLMTGMWWGFWMALIVGVFFGLPAHAILLARRASGLSDYMIAGVVVGLIAAGLAWVLMHNIPMTIAALAGAIAASATFWASFRPDRHLASTGS